MFAEVQKEKVLGIIHYLLEKGTKHMFFHTISYNSVTTFNISLLHLLNKTTCPDGDIVIVSDHRFSVQLLYKNSILVRVYKRPNNTDFILFVFIID